MIPYAKFQSINTPKGIKIFRYETELRSKTGEGRPIGLVYMLNPGSARPKDDYIFNKLKTEEYNTENHVLTVSDNTMKKVISLIKKAYLINGITLPEKYTVHIENLFNVREKNSNLAKRYARSIEYDKGHINFKSRRVEDYSYDFVWIAWGKTDIYRFRQQKIINLFTNAIKVNKLNVKGEIRQVNYPVHPLFMNTDFFIEAAEDKIG